MGEFVRQMCISLYLWLLAIFLVLLQDHSVAGLKYQLLLPFLKISAFSLPRKYLQVHLMRELYLMKRGLNKLAMLKKFFSGLAGSIFIILGNFKHPHGYLLSLSVNSIICGMPSVYVGHDMRPNGVVIAAMVLISGFGLINELGFVNLSNVIVSHESSSF